MLAPPRSPRRNSWNPRGTLVEPWWNSRGTLPQGRPGPPRSLSGLRPQSLQHHLVLANNSQGAVLVPLWNAELASASFILRLKSDPCVPEACLMHRGDGSSAKNQVRLRPRSRHLLSSQRNPSRQHRGLPFLWSVWLNIDGLQWCQFGNQYVAGPMRKASVHTNNPTN